MDLHDQKKHWSVLDILNTTTEYLRNRSFDNPRLNAEWLLADTLCCKRLDLYTDYDRPLTHDEIAGFRSRLLRRLKHEPLQYILGTTEFMGLTFCVNSDVLIPRPDTETLTETILNYFRTIKMDEPLRLLDIGTGSGAIIIALAKFFEKYQIACELFAMDISSRAVELAIQNAKNNDATGIRFFTADVFLDDWVSPFTGTLHGIVSNPPYISEKEFNRLPEEIKLHEPKTALLANNEGLMFYERIASLAPELLNRRCAGASIFFEIGYNQMRDVGKILQKNGFKNIEFVKDYQHIDRVVKAAL